MPLTQQQAIERLWRYGAFANRAFPDANNLGGPSVKDPTVAEPPKDLSKLTFDDRVVKEAVISFTEMMAIEGDRIANRIHGRPMIHDGEVRDATLELLEVPRCGAPDYALDAEPAQGSGSWRGCHGATTHHKASVYINYDSMPSFLRPLWPQIWANYVAAYAEIGLEFFETKDPQTHNTSMTWTRGSGWIGLAIVGNRQSCGSKIWQKFEQNYQGGSSDSARINQWSSLTVHEGGHNVGMGHTRGSIMNPSIINGLPMGRVAWLNDPALPQLRTLYGGEPIPNIPSPPPGPGPGPIPPTGNGPLISLSVRIPEGMTPGDYEYVAVPKRTV